MPGYTHLQPAQPVRWSHWLLSHAWAWQRDRERLADLLKRVDVLPLGSGALAGCPFAIDRAALATDLGFAAASPNSIDAVSDRDFIAEFLFWAALLGIHLSRFAEDLILWSSREFGFVTLADAYSTGSSLMPQKKNPDAAELLRGKAGRLTGGLTGLLMTLKGLPSSYDKDLQEDKEPLFDAVSTLGTALPIAQGVLETLAIHPERLAAGWSTSCSPPIWPTRWCWPACLSARAITWSARLCAAPRSSGCALRDVPLTDLQAISPYFTAEMAAVWDFERSVEQRSATGGTSRGGHPVADRGVTRKLMSCAPTGSAGESRLKPAGCHSSFAPAYATGSSVACHRSKNDDHCSGRARMNSSRTDRHCRVSPSGVSTAGSGMIGGRISMKLRPSGCR